VSGRVLPPTLRDSLKSTGAARTSIVGRTVAGYYDRDLRPRTGRVLRHEDDERCAVVWGDDPDHAARVHWLDDLREVAR